MVVFIITFVELFKLALYNFMLRFNKIFFLLAELYLESDRIEDAHDCVAEAISLSQINHELLYLVSRSP